jgi:L-amino acid N-acyltransferase YncA
MKQTACHVRAAGPGDLESLRAIYNEAVLHTTASYDYEPRTAEAQAKWFAAKQAAGYPVLVAVDGAGTVMGFASYGSFRNWAGYRFTVEHSVYVHAACRRQGIASTLVEHLLANAAEQGLHLMVGAIDAANAGSIELHRRLGFQAAGVLKEAGYKFGRRLDLAFMTRRIPDSPPAERGPGPTLT